MAKFFNMLKPPPQSSEEKNITLYNWIFPPDANIGYMQLSTYEIGYNAIVGLVSFIATVKCLRPLNFSSHVRELGRSFKLIRNELLSFAVVFFVTYFGFAT